MAGATYAIAKSEQRERDEAWEHVREYGYGASRPIDTSAYFVLWKKGKLSPEQYGAIQRVHRLIEIANGVQRSDDRVYVSGGLKDYHGKAMMMVRAQANVSSALAAARDDMTKAQRAIVLRAFQPPFPSMRALAPNSKWVAEALQQAAVQLEAHFTACAFVQITAANL